MARKKQSDKVWYGLIGLGVLVVIILFITNYNLLSKVKQLQTAPGMGMSMSRMNFTEFDKQKARELMDMNHDGKCDSCGMAIESCISSGMMECTMDPNARIGLLGSQHIHADWKLYLDGKEFDWSPFVDRHERQMKGEDINDTSAFMHMHPDANEPAGAVLHMHATGVPLSMFFESLGMKSEDYCLTIKGKKQCGIKMYVNGEENAELGNYEFKDLDKILITDGKGSIEERMKSITNFAEAH